MKKHLKKALIYTLAIVLMVVAWHVVYKIVANDYVVPSPWETFSKLDDVWNNSKFWVAYGNTMLRSVISFAISFIVAFVLAVLAKKSNFIRELLVPGLSVLRSIPTMAVVLMLLVWLTPKAAPIAVTLMVILPMLYTSILSAFDQVDGELISMCKVYKISWIRRVFGVYLPISGAYLTAESGAALSFSVKLMVSAEVLSNTYKSLGGMISQSKVYMDMPEMLALTLFAVVTGMIIELLFKLLERVLFKWRVYD